jgi:hypothetical protein
MDKLIRYRAELRREQADILKELQPYRRRPEREPD